MKWQQFSVFFKSFCTFGGRDFRVHFAFEYNSMKTWNLEKRKLYDFCSFWWEGCWDATWVDLWHSLLLSLTLILTLWLVGTARDSKKEARLFKKLMLEGPYSLIGDFETKKMELLLCDKAAILKYHKQSTLLFFQIFLRILLPAWMSWVSL